MPIVSVIIPSYNRAQCIKRAIKSVQAQRFKSMEIVIIDDGSTDNTEEIVKLIPDERIQYIRFDRNRGPGAARNEGLKVAQGKYIAFLDSDDEWLPNKMEKQITLMESLSNDWGVCHTGAYIRKDVNRKVLFKPREDYIGDVYLLHVLGKFRFLTPTLVIRKICFEKVGLFDEKLLRAQDVELLLRILKFYKIAVIPNPLTIINLKTNKLCSSIFTNHFEFSRLMILEKHEKEIQHQFGDKIARRFRARSFWLIADGNFRSRDYLKGIKYLLRSIIVNPFVSPIKYSKMFAIFLQLDKVVRRIRILLPPTRSL